MRAFEGKIGAGRVILGEARERVRRTAGQGSCGEGQDLVSAIGCTWLPTSATRSSGLRVVREQLRSEVKQLEAMTEALFEVIAVAAEAVAGDFSAVRASTVDLASRCVYAE